ncbi:MAG: hypothetical protein HOV79_32295 [Hamadaea sp.]|nr:hypothetical protein [Hamadaea sp.]
MIAILHPDGRLDIRPSIGLTGRPLAAVNHPLALTGRRPIILGRPDLVAWAGADRPRSTPNSVAADVIYDLGGPDLAVFGPVVFTGNDAGSVADVAPGDLALLSAIGRLHRRRAEPGNSAHGRAAAAAPVATAVVAPAAARALRPAPTATQPASPAGGR